MKWYVLLAHPNPKSFNHAVCRAFLDGLDEGGASYELNDLYATGFDPLMNMGDIEHYHLGGESAEDVRIEQRRVEEADALAMIYPVWWNEAPAILKGWFDRVLTRGWAYEITPEWDFLPLLPLERLLILNTADQPTDFLDYSGFRGATRLIKKEGTFEFCGVKEVEYHVLGSCSIDPQARAAFLEKARELGREG